MKIVVFLEITADGEKHPWKGSHSLLPFSEEFASQKVYLILDDLHESIFLLLGQSIPKIHLAIARRAANFIRSRGYQLPKLILGVGYDVIEINEGEELPAEFIELLEQELKAQKDYYVIVEAPVVRKSVLEVVGKGSLEEDHEVVLTAEDVEGLETMAEYLNQKLEEPENNLISGTLEMAKDPANNFKAIEEENSTELEPEVVLTPEDVKNLEVMAEYLDQEIAKHEASPIAWPSTTEKERAHVLQIANEEESVEVDSDTILTPRDLKAMSKYLDQEIEGQEKSKKKGEKPLNRLKKDENRS